MIPENRLSTQIMAAGILSPKSLRTPENLLIDYERGGIALKDSSAGMNIQDWQVNYDQSNGNVFLVSQLNPTPLLQFTRTGIKNLGLSFDQNMNPAIVFQLITNEVILWWFDPTPGIQAQVFTSVNGARNPAVTLDDKRRQTVSTSDVILAYQRNDGLYFRVQRERYTIEHLLLEDTGKQDLFRVAMGRNLRLHFSFTPYKK